MENIEVLKKIFLFKDLTSFELIRINRIIKNRRVKKGETIIEEDSPGNTIWVVKKGRVKIIKMVNKKYRRTIGTLVDFDFFGEMSFIDGYPRSATVIASTDTDLIEINGEELKKLLSNERDLALKIYVNLMQILCKRIRLANEHLIVLKHEED